MAQKYEWRRDNFLISTSEHLLQPSMIMAAYATPEMPHANQRTEADLRTLMKTSIYCGIYESSSSAADSSIKQVGLARFVTDHVAFAWGGDLYILPEYRRRGLATWLLQCVSEVIQSKPQLYSLCTAGPESIKIVERDLGMKPWTTKRPGARLMSRRNILDDVL